MRFAGRVVLGTILVLLLAILTLVWVSQRGLRGDLEREIAHALLAEARLVARVLPADPGDWSRAAADYAAATGHRVTLISREGRVQGINSCGSRAGRTRWTRRPSIRKATASSSGSPRAWDVRCRR